MDIPTDCPGPSRLRGQLRHHGGGDPYLPPTGNVWSGVCAAVAVHPAEAVHAGCYAGPLYVSGYGIYDDDGLSIGAK